MNKSQRIFIDPNTPITDNHIIVKLDQEVDTLEFLSMKLDLNDIYRDFNADYGVLVGRVLANGGIGVPNAKISIFIPLSDTDANIGEIANIYPYVNPTDKNNDGKRYNLLPRVSQINPNTGVSSPKQPFGSFPIKPELVTNLEFLDVYKKYYKYTALTNSAGDYMIFGVPIGTQTVHMSVDITDIGKYSMTPAAMVVNLGYSPNLFTDNNTRIKPSNDLSDLPNIETQEISVDIAPFWGDTTNFTIGITRQDFRIRATLVNTFVIFGSVFTDGNNSMWGTNSDPNVLKNRELYYITDEGNLNISIRSKRIGLVTEKIYYYPNTVTDDDIAKDKIKDDGSDMVLLSPTEYSIYKRNGDFAIILNCNRSRVVTDEFGNEASISETSPNGIFTKFKGFMTLEITPDAIPMDFIGSIGADTNINPFRYIFKFPQSAPIGQSFREEKENDVSAITDTAIWRKQHYTFSGGSIYSVSRFHGVVYNDDKEQSETNGIRNLVYNNSFSQSDQINIPYGRDPFRDVGVIQTNDTSSITGNTKYHMVSNSSYGESQLFGANWLNLSIHLPQVGYLWNGYAYVGYWRSNTNFTQQFVSPFYYEDNKQKIAAGEINTRGFARSDLHWTDFINVPKKDILAMNDPNLLKGFTNQDIIGGLTGSTYRNGTYTPPTGNWITPCPMNGGKTEGNPANPPDPFKYFYKGFDTADCIDFIVGLGLV